MLFRLSPGLRPSGNWLHMRTAGLGVALLGSFHIGHEMVDQCFHFSGFSGKFTGSGENLVSGGTGFAGRLRDPLNIG